VSTSTLTRRAALAALGALALQGCASAVPTATTGGVRFRDIVVDVSPILASIGDPTAAWVQQEVPEALAQALGPYMAPGDRNGATLVARIDYLYLGPSTGGTGPGGSAQDTIKGVLIVKGAHGRVAAETPLRAISFYYPMAVDQALVERAYHGRVTALAQAFAGWVPRQLGLG
jgi:hypothetical protein